MKPNEISQSIIHFSYDTLCRLQIAVVSVLLQEIILYTKSVLFFDKSDFYSENETSKNRKRQGSTEKRLYSSLQCALLFDSYVV